jgi:hypothetical protein
VWIGRCLQLSYCCFSPGLILADAKPSEYLTKVTDFQLKEMQDYLQDKNDIKIGSDLFLLLQAILQSSPSRFPPGLEFIFVYDCDASDAKAKTEKGDETQDIDNFVRGENDSGLLCSLYHLQFYLRFISDRVPSDVPVAKVIIEMANLCMAVLISQKSKGMVWESLVAFIFLVRCAMGFPDGVVIPVDWFPDDLRWTFEYNPYTAYDCDDGELVCLDNCDHWGALKEGIFRKLDSDMAAAESLEEEEKEAASKTKLIVAVPPKGTFKTIDVAGIVKEGDDCKYLFLQMKAAESGEQAERESSSEHPDFDSGKSIVVLKGESADKMTADGFLGALRHLLPRRIDQLQSEAKKK